MIGFYYGNTIPGSDAKEGVYFINIDDNEYSIYIKRKDEAAIKYGEINSVTPEILDNYFTKTDADNKSNIGHTHEITPTGTVSQPEFTGTPAIIEADYTPVGTITQPTFEGQEISHDHSFTGTKGTAIANYTPTGTVSQPTFTGAKNPSSAASQDDGHTTTVLTEVKTEGTLPTLNYTAPSCDYDPATFAPVVESGVLKFNFKGGEVDFSAGSATLNPGEMPTFSTGSAATSSHIHEVTPEGIVSQPEFTGAVATIEADYTPTGTISPVAFTPIGTVSQPEFTGAEATIQTSYTPVGTVSQPTFTGDTVTTNGDVKPTV